MDLVILGFYLLILFLALIWLLGLRASKHERPVLSFEPGREKPFSVSWNGAVVHEATPEKAVYVMFEKVFPELCIWEVMQVDEEDKGFEEWKRNSGK